MMGCVWTILENYVVRKVDAVISRYEIDGSFRAINDEDLMYIPKFYLMRKVRCLDLENVWYRLPRVYKEDVDLLGCRPCTSHLSLEGDVIDGVIRRRDCYMCRYNLLYDK